MARPFRNEFEKDSSPMSPLSSGSGTPTSWKTNVNRQKTKKWVEAKPADYGGDDWGDDDEYDVPPPAISKPTGLRQKGQALQSPISDSGKKPYGDLPSLPPDPRGRSNSFDADDERRNFSGPPLATPATRFSQITSTGPRVASGPPALHITTQQPPPVSEVRNASQVVSPVYGSPRPPMHQPGPSDSPSKSVVSPVSDARTPSSDYQARRDFSPSAVPPPLHTRASPAPQSATETTSARFPPRKSSMGHQAAPNPANFTRLRQESPGPRPWTTDRSSSPNGSPAATSSTKPLPFVRPADIYRRVEEEREKERQSIDSSRPSMDSILGGRPESAGRQYPRDQSLERSSSPGKPQIRERLSSDSLGGVGRRRASLEGDEGTESSRRLTPMLAPVQERKSEYGFEGFNASQQAPKHSGEPPKVSSDPVAVEEARVQSISPKLPDLNRLSGFGMDMFSQSRPEEHPFTQEPVSSPPSASTPQPASTLPPSSSITTKSTLPTGSSLPTNSTLPPVTTTYSDSQPTGDPALRNQPSLGFRSVVNQAFDRPERAESSVPPTPALSDSGVRRTDSESTGTTGISPIMSRVSSVANPETRARDGTGALEVVNETSPVQSNSERNLPSHGSDDEPLPAAFKPGHRRDLSTPSPGNSPARTPDLAKNETIPQAEYALLSRAPGSVTGEAPLSNEEFSQPRRPFAEREQSFRPQLPGGWQSYATTATGNATPSEDMSAPISDLARSQTPAPDVSPIRENQDEDDYDATPTTKKHFLPHSASAAGAEALLGGAAGRASGSHRDISPDSPRVASSYDSMPTPDLAMAPSGSVYSSNALDSRLLPKLERVSPEAQLRPSVGDTAISTDSSAAPTPPPKNSPLPETSQDSASGYFPRPTVPLKQRSPGDLDDDDLQPPTRPQILPTLSTDTRPHDEENDKLRKEIIKSLSPRTSLAAPRNDLSPTDHLEDLDPSAQARESTYLPESIYDNYWQGDEGEEGSIPLSKNTTREETIPEEAAHPKTVPDIVMNNNESDIPPTPPLNTRRSQQSQLSANEPRPSAMNRFSWEQSSEHLPQPPQADLPTTVGGIVSDTPSVKADDEKVLPSGHAYQPRKDKEDIGSSRNSESSDENRGLDTAFLAGSLAIGGTAIATHMHHTSQSSPSPEQRRRLSLAEEKDPRVSSYPVSPTPPEDEHPARSSLPYVPGDSDQHRVSISSSPRMTTAEPNIPSGQPLSPTSRLLQFREITAMKDPYQRIQAFDEHRHRFAVMDSGLSDWLYEMRSQHPELSDEPGWGGIMTSPTGRSKTAKATGTGLPSQPPQPYYQQYLNASSPTTPTSTAPRPGPNVPAGSPQGFSSGGGKITSQQVQAKGKELLHTAGIFSGKAGKGAAKAGKGLLAKGKSRFRGSGAGDKIATTPPKPKNDRRSSWGLPLALSRSTNRPDPSRTSREIPSRPSYSREVTNTSEVAYSSPHPSTILPKSLDLGQVTSHGAPQLQFLGPLPSPSLSREFSHIPTGNQPVSPAEEDNISGPVPISKDPPSWDPYNSTPIVEEEVFNFDEKPKQLAVLPIPLEENGTRSNSGDAHFYDAHEEPSRDEDWVMVSPEPESNVSNEIEPAKAADEPVVTSILQRPRGSFDVTKSPPFLPPALTPSAVGHDLAESLSSTSKEVAAVPPPAPKQAEPDYVIPRDPSFRSLPPIRRTSTFGFGFGPRQPKPRFPIDDEDEDEPNGPPRVEWPPPPITETAAAISNVAHRDRSPQPKTHDFEFQGEAKQTQTRPNLVHASSSEYSQQSKQRIAQPNIQRQPSLPRGPSPGENNQKTGLQSSLHRESSGPRISASSEYSQQSQQRITQPSLQREPNVPRIPDSSEYSQQKTPRQSLQREPSIPRGPSSSEYVQQRLARQSLQREPSIPRIADIGPVISQRSSLDAWRPNGGAGQGPRRSEDAWRPNAVPPPSIQRQYVDPQQNRPPISQHQDALSRSISNQQQKLFEQPPSSAFRYPKLFGAGQQPDADGFRDSGELPDHYYQQPIQREEAFLPRQQTSEYQLPGVGPPTDEPRFTGSRRNSFFGGLGGKKSRNASRERGGSISRDEERRQVDSRGNEISESNPTPDEAQRGHRRKSSFFGSLNRVSTGGTGPPQSRDSITAQASGSRIDLLKFATPQPSPLDSPDKKRSLFASSSTSQPTKERAKKLSRASTSTVADDGTGKKKRFSAFSSMFSGREKRSSKGSVSELQASQSNEGSQHQPSPRSAVYSQTQHPAELHRAQSQHSISGAQDQISQSAAQNPSRARSQQRKLTKQPSLRESSRTRQESRPRRTSSSFLGGMLGRRSQDIRREEQDTSPKPPQSPQPTVPNLDASQDSQHVPQQARIVPWQDSAPPQQQEQYLQHQHEIRGRRSSRESEPVYDNVPIPSGYSLVRGENGQSQGLYDPRGFNQQYSPQPQSQQYYNPQQQQSRFPQTDGAGDIRERQNRPPNLGALETYEDYQRRTPRRLSREDLLARSPAREPEGQQRPYQLSLPGEDPPQRVSQDVHQQMPRLITQSVNNRLQQLQQPVLRHPESPAGYPLPQDTTFSPVNPKARNMPAPPAPQWPQQQISDGERRGLERSNTGRTGSEVSQVSNEATRSLAPQKRNKSGSPSPTPSSPGVTPERVESPGPTRQTVTAPVKENDDLYDASPRVRAKANGNRDEDHEGKEVVSGSRRGREQEEKIFYGGEGIPPERDDDANATMSATSYPGQEWHPFTGGYEDWD